MGKETGIDLRFKAVLIALVSALVGFGLFSSCRGAKGKKGKKGALVIPVVLQEAVNVDLAVEVRLAGEVQADVEVRVISLVPDRITKLTFEEGDTVKKGELLAVIKPGALYDAVRQAKAGLTAAKTQRNLAKIEMERARNLYKSGTVAIAHVQRAEAQHAAAAAQVKQMRAVLGGSYSNISRINIRAPITGVIGRRFLSKGDMAGPTVPLCTIIQTAKVRIKAMATEFDVVKLKKKQPARISVPAFKRREWKGKVDYISPVLDRVTRSAWVTLLVDNPDAKLKPGMFADVVVEVGRRPNITMVHAKSITRWTQADGKTVYHVYTVNSDKAVHREVGIGARKGDLIEITRGLKPGEMVVTLGSHRLREGSSVKVKRRVTGSDVAKKPGKRPTPDTAAKSRANPGKKDTSKPPPSARASVPARRSR